MEPETSGPEAMQVSALTVEALLAVTGIFPDTALTPKDGKLAAALPKQWRAEVKAFLDDKEFRRFKAPKTVDVVDTLERLLDQLDADHHEVVDRLASRELGDAYLAKLAEARGWLAERFPQVRQDTPLGPRALPIGPIESGRITAVIAVIDDPSRILDEIRSGSLTTAQASAFRQVYPRLAEMLRTLVWGELTARYKTPEKYDLPWAKERVIRTLVGLPPDIGLSKAEPGRPGRPPQVRIDFKTLATKAQQLARQ